MGRGGEDENVPTAGKDEDDPDIEPAYESDSDDKDPLMNSQDLFVRHNATKEDAKDTGLMAWWLCVLCAIMTVHILVCGVIMYVYEDWSFETGVYFALVTMSSIGYGQFVPTRLGTKLYTIWFIISGLVLAGVFVSVLQMKVLDSMIMRSHAHASRWAALILPGSLTLLFLAVYSTVLMFADDMSVIDAWYFVVVTFSTVGYGDIVLGSANSRILGIFFLVGGTLLFAFLLTTIINLATTEYKLRQCQLFFGRPITRPLLMQMDTNGSGDVSRAEFMEYMLLASNMVDPEILGEINSAFDKAVVMDGAAPQVAPRVVLNLSHIKS